MLLLLAPLMAMAPSRASERWLAIEFPSLDAADTARVGALGWEAQPVDGGNTRVYLPASAIAEVRALGLDFVVALDDVAGYYASRLHDDNAALGPGSMGGYYTFVEAVAEMDALVVAHPTLVAAKRSLGQSREGRDLWAWKVSARADLDEDEPEILLLSLMHAREPIGMMSLLHLAEGLLAGYGSEPEATYLLDHREIWILPVLNPDGYVHNQNNSPGGGGMWRKNRRDNGGSFGVDINRNFGYLWGYDDSGSSPNANSDTYRGDAAFSEPETQAVRDFAIARPLAISVNTHAFGDYLIRPWAYVDALCADDAVYEDLSRVATRGNAFKTGNVWRTLNYLANGDHDSWMYGESAVKPIVFGFTPEIGNADDGFWPATTRIAPLVADGVPMHRSLVWASGPAPRPLGFVVDDATLGDGDANPSPGETFDLPVTIFNHGLSATWGALSARLASNSCALEVLTPSVDLGVVPSEAGVVATFRVRAAASAEIGAIASASLVLTDDRGAYPSSPVELLVGAPALLFADDLESGMGLWSLAGFGAGAAGAGRTGTALSDSPSGNYANDADNVATIAAPLDLRGFERVWLRFDQRFWIDNDFDAATIEISTDGGASFATASGRLTGDASGVGVQAAGTRVYDGRLWEWTLELVDLSSYVGNADVRVRFRLQSNGSVRYDGWYVDEVALLGFGATTAFPPNEPSRLLAARQGSDVAFSWQPPAVDPGHQPATGYTLHRSGVVRANAGFLELAVGSATTATDAAAVPDARSFSYQVVASNCAGVSSAPPR